MIFYFGLCYYMSIQPTVSTDNITLKFQNMKNYNTIRYFVTHCVERVFQEKLYELRGGYLATTFINQFVLNSIGRELYKLLLNSPDISDKLLYSIYGSQIEYVCDINNLQSLCSTFTQMANKHIVTKMHPEYTFWMMVKAYICKQSNLDYDMYNLSLQCTLNPRYTTCSICALLQYINVNNPNDVRNNTLYTFKLFDLHGVYNYIHNDTYNIVEYLQNEPTRIINAIYSRTYSNTIFTDCQQLLLLLNAMYEGCLNLKTINNYTNQFEKFLSLPQNWYNIYGVILPTIKSILQKPDGLEIFFVFSRKNETNIDLYVNDMSMLDKIFSKNYIQIMQTSTKYLTIIPPTYVHHPNHPIIEQLLPIIGISRSTDTGYLATQLATDSVLIKKYNTYIKFLSSMDKQELLADYTIHTYSRINDYAKEMIYNTQPIYDQQLEDANMLIYNMSKELRPHHNILFNEMHGSCYAYRHSLYVATGPNGGYYELQVGDTFIEPSILSCGLETGTTTLGNRFVRFEIEFDISTQYILVTDYSQTMPEKEVIFPAGSKFKVTKFTETVDDGGNYILTIKMKLMGCIEYSNMQEFGRKYREYLFNKGSIIMPSIQNTPNDISIEIVKQLYYKPSIFTQFEPIADIYPIEPYFIYRPSYGRVTYAPFPDFNSDQAYVGEYLAGNKNQFCNTNFIVPTLNNTDNDLNIITFNVHNFVRICPPNIGRSLNHFIEFMTKITNNSRIDVVCLQEVAPIYDKKPITPKEIINGTLTPLIDAMKKLGFNYNVCTNTTWDISSLVNNYYMLVNCIFSRNEIISTDNFGLPDNRCAQVAKIRNGDMIHVIINTHLEYDTYKSLQIHCKPMNVLQTQINCIRNIIQNYSKLYPVFITGDFNHDIVRNNTFTPLTNICQIISPIYNSTHHEYTGFNSGNIIDYVLMTNATTTIYEPIKKMIMDSNVSDHYPVLVSLRKKTMTFNYIPTNKKEIMESLKRKIINWFTINKNLYIHYPIKIGKTLDCDIIITSEIVESEIAPFYIHINSDGFRESLKYIISELEKIMSVNVLLAL